jgi:hypothetical protein
MRMSKSRANPDSWRLRLSSMLKMSKKDRPLYSFYEIEEKGADKYDSLTA